MNQSIDLRNNNDVSKNDTKIKYLFFYSNGLFETKTFLLYFFKLFPFYHE